MKKKKKVNYFDAFKKQTKYAVEEANILLESIQNFENAEKLYKPMQKAHVIEHEADIVQHVVHTYIASDFITPIDREDILELMHCLDDIIDRIENVLQLFYIYDVKEVNKRSCELAEVLKKACICLDQATSKLDNFKKEKDELKKYLVEVNSAEEDGDLLYVETVRELYTNHKDDTMYVLVWSSIFERLEDCIDSCENAADIITSVIIKNS